jgi:hypothetical protein
VTGAVVTVIRHAGKVAAGALPAVLVAGLGLPALGGLVFLAVLVLGAACWVLGNEDRTARLSRVLLAWRGNARCLPPGGAAPTASPGPRPRRRTLPRRS